MGVQWTVLTPPFGSSYYSIHITKLCSTMLSILRKARLKDKEMRVLMLYVPGQS